MDKRKIGKTITYLRKRAGYTQQDLADRIGISDKAVSKWERGIGLPDVAYLGKLATLLNTDTDSLLSGEVLQHEDDWRGVLILPPGSSFIHAGSMVYSKPLVYYLLSYYVLVGIRKIYICADKTDESCIQQMFGNGSELNLSLIWCGMEYDSVKQTLSRDGYTGNLMIIHERMLLYGVDQTKFFYRAMHKKDRVTIMSLPKKYDHREPSIYFNVSGQLVSDGAADKVHTVYDYYEIPIIFTPAALAGRILCSDFEGNVSVRITERDQVYTEIMDRGFVEMRIDTPDQLLDASEFVKLVQNACGMEIYCIEEIAWRRGMISLEKLRELGNAKKGTRYGQYILSLADRYTDHE